MSGSRSHTDALTNLVVLSTLDIGRHFREILERDLPIPTLPTFLHEATHHWCFNTPVGLTLHLLFMRARRSAAQAGEDRWQTLDSVVRYEMARDFVQPLSEGLALFAEHDAVPGHAKTISTPMSLAAALYARGYGFEGNEPYEGLPLVLAAARVSRSHVRRKASLLLEPMSCAKGGYLPGYLLIKALWQYAQYQSDLFRDSDFFLQYLRMHLFDDWALVARLLDDTRKDISALDPIVSRIADRIRTFEAAIRGDRPRRFEELSEDPVRWDVLQVRTKLLETEIRFVSMDEEPDDDLGRQRLKEALASHFGGWTGDAMTDALLAADLAELSQRSIVVLGQITVQGAPTAEGLQLSFDGAPLATLPRDRFPQAASVDGPVELELLSLEQPGGLCLTLRHDGRFVCSVPIGAADLPDGLKETLVSRAERAAQATFSYALIDGALARADLRDTVAVIRERVYAALEEWLIPLALMHVDAERLPELSRRMRENGLLTVFGDDANLLVDAAVASLCIPSPYNFASVESFHQWSDVTPQDAVRRIVDAVIRELGFPPFQVDDNGTFVKVSFI